MDRLDVIASLTKGYKTLADIGSDHGYVCIEAIKKYGVEKAYACDINEGPLLNAMNNIKHYNLTNSIKTILSDGLKNFNDDVECITICGMGGVLIKKILTESLEKALKSKVLILQPNNEEACLREFLFNNGFFVKSEVIVKDKKHFYEIIVCIPNKRCEYDKLDIIFGPCLRAQKSFVFIEKWTNKLNILKNNYDKASESKKMELNEKIKLIEEVL